MASSPLCEKAVPPHTSLLTLPEGHNGEGRRNMVTPMLKLGIVAPADTVRQHQKRVNQQVISRTQDPNFR
eukprot:12893390-Prorocentrum_lima.AAC.1